MLPSLECPVTLESFRHPKVLPCGHTIDNDVIRQLKKRQCPICRRPFFANPPTNWILVDLLNLRIDSTRSPMNCLSRLCGRQRHAVKMHEHTQNTIDRMIESNESRVFTKIARCADKGIFETTFNMTEIRTYGMHWDQQEYVFLTIATRLERCGYSIEHKPIVNCVGAYVPQIYIRWSAI
jgi:hypothetical protein